jgi:hypothetical protein
MGTFLGQRGSLICRLVDFFVGLLADNVYAYRPQNIAELKLRILEEIDSVPVKMLRCVMGNMCSRLEECLRKGGGHLEDVVFKK